MNNAITMSAQLESKYRSQAMLITAGISAIMVILMFLLKWGLPKIVPPEPELGVLVEMNIPDEEMLTSPVSGGGGGGNPVQSAGPAGAAPYSPPPPGTDDDARDVEESDDKTEPAILKPDVAKPDAKKLNENKSPIKKEVVKDPPPPAPPKPKATLGRTVSGSGTGGGAATDYDRSGGTGTGYGVGNGSGTGGGTGTGAGGGNGSGVGGGNGPRVIGDREIVTSYSFTGELERNTVYAEVRVNAAGVGTFMGFGRNSTTTTSQYRNAIVEYLRKIRFNKADHESTVTVVFNFKVNG